MSSLSLDEVKSVAEAVSTALKRLGNASCIVGSVACCIWGMQNRTPQDVDIVVLDGRVDLETLKRSIADTDRRFYLVNSVNPLAAYKVLWYQLPNSTSRCKVDLLKPGELGIPSVPEDQLYTLKNYENIRVMPFVPVLLLKVQAWRHHDTSDKLHFQQKVPQDVHDINELLDIAIRSGYKLRDVQNWLPGWIRDVGRRHVEQFKREHSSSINSWATVTGW